MVTLSGGPAVNTKETAEEIDITNVVVAMGIVGTIRSFCSPCHWKLLSGTTCLSSQM